MSLQKYEAFVKANETGSFKAAAKELGYTQAGISYMLKALEDEMGVTLFLRDRNGVRLSSEGQNLLPWIQDVCNDERRLRMRLDELKQGEAGTLRVAAFASTAVHWLPGMIDSFLSEHPKITLELSCEEDQSELEELIGGGKVDCGFVVLPIKRDLEVIPLKEERMLAVMSRSNPLADAPFFPRSALATQPYIKLRSESNPEVDAVFTQHNVQPNIRFTMDNDYAVMGMVDKNLGYSLFSELILRDIPFPLVCKELEVPSWREVCFAARSFEKAPATTLAFTACVQRWLSEN